MDLFGFTCVTSSPFALGISAITIIFSLIFLFGDADLTLLVYSWFGKSPRSLVGKVVWITGASSGIGEYLCYDMVRVGCKLVISGRRQQELERVKKQCLLTGKVEENDIYILPFDMTELHVHKKMVEEVIERFGKVDILVNNAGRSQRAFLKDTDIEVDKALMDLNYLSVVSLTKAILPVMIKQMAGHIVVTSSVAGKLGAPMSASYSASKFALHGWFETARIELSNQKIGITMVCPGPVFSKLQFNAITETVDGTYNIDTQPTEKKMATSRCTKLMMTAIANRMPEVWISLQPILLFTYMAQYTPSLYKMMATLFGKKMALVEQLRREGTPFRST